MAVKIQNGLTGRTEMVGLHEGFDSSGWNRLALPLSPDGVVSLAVNRNLLRTMDFRMRMEPESRWRIRLFGASVDTHAYVRSVVAWPGVRYPG